MEGFIQQTADDYAMTFDDVKIIYEKYANKFYEKLEEFIKQRTK